jgi:hypothetical protein
MDQTRRLLKVAAPETTCIARIYTCVFLENRGASRVWVRGNKFIFVLLVPTVSVRKYELLSRFDYHNGSSGFCALVLRVLVTTEIYSSSV